MDLGNALEQLLASIQDEGERATLRASLEKHEPLRKGYLAQEDYSRNMNQLAQERSQAEREKAEQEARNAQWLSWYESHGGQAAVERMQAERAAAVRKAEELERQVAASVAASGVGAGDQDAVKALVRAELATHGYVRPADVDAAVKSATDALRTQYNEDLSKRVLPEAMRWAVGMSTVAHRHERNFGGEELDPAVLAKFMSDNNMVDPTKAYSAFIAPRLHEQALEKARQEGFERAQKEAAAARMPGNGAAPASEMGPLAASMRRQNGNVFQMPDNHEIGDGTAAIAAAQALIAAGKG